MQLIIGREPLTTAIAKESFAEFHRVDMLSINDIQSLMLVRPLLYLGSTVSVSVVREIVLIAESLSIRVVSLSAFDIVGSGCIVIAVVVEVWLRGIIVLLVHFIFDPTLVNRHAGGVIGVIASAI